MFVKMQFNNSCSLSYNDDRLLGGYPFNSGSIDVNSEIGTMIVTKINSIDSYSASKISDSELINQIDDILNYTISSYNEVFKLNLIKSFEPNLYNALRGTLVEDDELLNLSYDLKIYLKINYSVTSDWLAQFYLANLSKENVLSNLLRLLGLIEGYLFSASMVLMIAHAVSLKSIQVKRNALEVLENLILESRQDAYKLLSEMDVIGQPRLEKYRQAVLAKNMLMGE